MGLLTGPPEIYLDPANLKQVYLNPKPKPKSPSTFSPTGNPCLDFFFHVVPGTPSDYLIERLQLAWKFDPLTTLKLICNLRGVKGTGKADKEGFYNAALWLLKNHPKTLIFNLEKIVQFGYLKDLLKIINRDPKNKSLFDQVSKFFAQLLVSDLGLLKCGFARKISLASKFFPAADDSSSVCYNELLESIAKQVFDNNTMTGEGARDRLQCQVLRPLREALQMPEMYMSSNRWKEIRYNRVASVAMNKYKDLFMKRDQNRFLAYLKDVKNGNAKISAGALLPHEILESVLDNDDKVEQVAELQWRRMIKDLSQNGKLKECMAICDVSDSMEETALNACIALGLLISDLSEDPWKGKLITFSENPKIHNLKGKLGNKKRTVMEEMKRGKAKDIGKVFDLILQVSKAGNLNQIHMIKRVFVLSDMDFEQDIDHIGLSYYQSFRKKFSEGGYGWAVPEIVFWKVHHSDGTTAVHSQKGAALVSGYSRNLVKLFVNGSKIDSPMHVMKSAISGEEYQKLTVFD